MPMRPSGVSEIFCLSMLELFELGWWAWFSESGRPGRAVESETIKTPFMLQECSFFSNLSLEFCFLTPAILPSYCFMHSIPWKFQSIALKPRYYEKWFGWAFHKLFFSCCVSFTWIWTFKTHDLTDHQPTVGNFLLAIGSVRKYRRISRWPPFFRGDYPSLRHALQVSDQFQSANYVSEPCQRLLLDFLVANSVTRSRVNERLPTVIIILSTL